jgi:hypothetical protein
MDWNDKHEIRGLMTGLRFCLEVLERGMTLRQHGQDVTAQRAEELRRRSPISKGSLCPKVNEGGGTRERAYQLRLYKRRPGSMPLHDHVQSIRLEAASDEEAVEQARVAEVSDLQSDCAIVFNDASEVIALWNVRDA